jgi:hypothetical protein
MLQRGVKMSPAAKAAQEAARAKAQVQLSEKQRTVQAKSKEGSVILEGESVHTFRVVVVKSHHCEKGIFVGNRPAGKGKAKAVAAEGQGGPTKKDPPVVMNVIPFVRQLASRPSPKAEYKVIDASTIAFPARSSQDMKKARDALKVFWVVSLLIARVLNRMARQQTLQKRRR